MGSGLKLPRITQLVPKTLNHQADQTIRGSVRKKGPIEPKSKVEMDTQKHNWACEFYEIQNRIGRGQCRRGGCECIECPATCNEKACTGPHCNSIFHAATSCSSDLIIPPTAPNFKRDLRQLADLSRDSEIKANLLSCGREDGSKRVMLIAVSILVALRS